VKDQRVYLLHAIDAVDAILRYTAEGREAFFADAKTQDAVIRNIEIIGEAVKALSDDTRALDPEVPWRRIAGMRDTDSPKTDGRGAPGVKLTNPPSTVPSALLATSLYQYLSEPPGRPVTSTAGTSCMVSPVSGPPRIASAGSVRTSRGDDYAWADAGRPHATQLTARNPATPIARILTWRSRRYAPMADMLPQGSAKVKHASHPGAESDLEHPLASREPEPVNRFTGQCRVHTSHYAPDPRPQQRTAVLVCAALLAGAGDVRIHTGEDRVLGCARHQLTPGSRRSTACRSADRNRANDGRFAPVSMCSCRNICRCLSPRLRLL
jgi:hypothetical protein